MKNFTKMKFWMLLMVMGLVASSSFAQGPILKVTPEVLNLGEWPIGGWQENAYFELANTGTANLEVTDSELDDDDGVFTLAPLSTPFTLSPLGSSTMVGVSFTGEGVADGVYNATYVASWEDSKSVTTADVTVTAYTAVVGDIVENPFMVTLPHADAGVTTALPMRANYVIPGAATNGKDVVYKFTLAEDKELNVAVTNATETAKVAIYAEDFNGEGGPSVTNAIVSGANITNTPLYTGTYYLVVSCEAADAAMTFDINIDATTMPDPEKAFNPSPADAAIEIPSNGIVLSWEFGQFTNMYKLTFGTTYPPNEILQDWTSELATTYALPNLDPSMQYFWRVDVKNNNGTVEGDVWGFTTTLTPPSALTATVVENAEDDYDVRLDWTASAKSLLSYNVYRDAALIGTTLVGVNTYTDEDLAYNMNPCYEYTVEAIFDEGVSELSNTASACITGVGTVEGFVTELLNPGTPIEGAQVTLVGPRTYNLDLTDVVGFYSAEVLEGTYTYTVSMDGYITEVRENVVVDYNTTVTEDFELDEFPYPVNDVVATETNDNTVQVDWGNNGGGGGSVAEWLFYDDGVNVDGIGGPAAFTWAIKYDAAQLVDFPGSSVTKFQFYARTPDNVEFVVMQGDNGETTLYTEVISGLTVDAWNEVELATPVAFDNSQALWIGMYTTAGTAYPASCGAAMGEPNGDLITLDGVLWEHLTDFGLMNTWNLRGFVTDAAGKSFSLNKATAPYYKNVDAEFTAANVAPKANAALPKVADVNAKEIAGYNVYRQACNESTPMEFLGMTIDNQFTDNTWGAATWGTYKWAVEVIYTNNVSEVAYSNCLDKDMIAAVDVVVTTNSGDAPEGCDVLFTNISESALGLTYETELDATGLFAWDEFRKGTYNIEVRLAGFADLDFADVVIGEDMTFVWELEELIAPASDLYVTPTGFATWGGGGALPWEPSFEGFETGDYSAFDWQFGAFGWNVVAEPYEGDYSSKSADIDNSQTATMEISYTLEDDGILSFFYKVSSETNWDYLEFYINGALQDDWSGVIGWTEATYDLAAGDYTFSWQYVKDGSVSSNDDCAWVDNIIFDAPAGKYSTKEFQNFKIWHDGVFSNDVDTTFYQYGTNPITDILVPGETYIAEVATLYSTGLSAKIGYEWTYLPCDSFAGPSVLDAYNVDGSDDVLVLWTDMIPLELVEINQGYGAPANGLFQFFGMGYGVAYDFTDYPDALVNAVSFRHSPWGVNGTWDYMIHVINRDDNTTIASVGPFQTTGDDQWETGVELGDIATGGATTVAILMEPMGNAANDAYPCLDGDDDANVQGSIYGDLADLAGLGASGVGNFLMDVWIYTANGGKKSASVVMSSIEGPAATARVANNNTFNPTSVVSQVANKSSKAAAISIGTNVYRDGEMIAYVADPDTFYMDMDLMPGYYDYCIATVYTEDDGLHTWTSCTDGTCVDDVLVPEDCFAPEDLTAEDLLGDGYTATLNWVVPGGNFDPLWIGYDDGVNVDAIGGPAEFSLAVKWDPSQLVDFDGTAITKIKFYCAADGASFTLKIWKGANASTLLHEQPISGITPDSWNEIVLTNPVEIDITDELWVGYYLVTNGYNAGCGNFTGNPNSDLLTLDGSLWEHMADYGLPYSWNIGAYVESAKGQVSELPSLVDHATYSSPDATIVAGNLPASPNAVDPFAGVTEFLGYNVYRDGTQVNDDLVMETTYADVTGVAGYFCYEVTAVYSVCGESDASNEACVDVAIGVNELENNISVYPNPAQDFVMVEASSDIRSIEITNYMGQVVNSTKEVEATQTRIETSSLSAGVYFVEVETDAGIETVRIIISK